MDQPPTLSLVTLTNADPAAAAAFLRLPRLWLATNDSYISSEPLASDIHPGLVRNINGLLRPNGRLHQHVEILGEYRFTDTPFLHTTAVTNPLSQRRERAAGYQRAGSPRLASGESVNLLYVPEERADLGDTAPLSASDAERVRTFVEEQNAVWPAASSPSSTSVTPAPALEVGAPEPRTQRRFRPGKRGRREEFIDDLQALHDALARTAFADRHWVWSGMLLGWAREGNLLAGDLHDADFCFIAGDPAFPGAAEALINAGFTPHLRYVNNAGRTTEWVFERGGAKFEFWELERDADRLTYHSYTKGDGELGPPCQAQATVPAQQRERFKSLGRRWSKVIDHAAELTAMYGDWRTPDADWYCTAGGAISSRELWYRTDTQWDGCFDQKATS